MLLMNSLNNFGIAFSGMKNFTFKRTYHQSVTIRSVGKIYATRRYGKSGRGKYSDVFLNLNRDCSHGGFNPFLGFKQILYVCLLGVLTN